MKDLKKLTIYEIFEDALGKEKADQFFKKISTGIEGKKGVSLKKFIYNVLCELEITDIKIFEISDTLIQVITRQVATKA